MTRNEYSIEKYVGRPGAFPFPISPRVINNASDANAFNAWFLEAPMQFATVTLGSDLLSYLDVL